MKINKTRFKNNNKNYIKKIYKLKKKIKVYKQKTKN